MNYGSDVNNTDSITEAGNKILNAHLAGDVVVICATCVVQYVGTAESKLLPEKRTIILKPDESLLVHSSDGVKPVNWQTSKASITIDIDNGNLLIESIYKEEKLLIKCFTIHKSIHYTPPEKDVKSMVGTENDMHAAIIKTPDIIEDGLHSIEHEKHIRSGSIDIYAKDVDGTPVVIEVKRRKAQLKHVDQLQRYVKNIEEDKEDVRGILVAPKISESAHEELKRKNLSFKTLNPKDLIPDDFN